MSVYIVEPGNTPRLIKRFNQWVMLHFQGAAAGAAGTFRIASEQLTLINPSANNIPQGLKIQLTDGVKSFWWIGELYAVGDTVQASFDLEVMTLPNAQLMRAHAGMVRNDSSLGGIPTPGFMDPEADVGSSQ
jgi:hypothetical protein